MKTGGETASPSGFTAFCKRAPAECSSDSVRVSDDPIALIASDAGTTAAIAADARRTSASRNAKVEPAAAGQGSEIRATLTQARWLELQDINRELNSAIRPLTDAEAFGRQEYWTMPLTIEGVAVGDCEDYALEKRRALIARGWPEETLLLAAAMAPGFGRHAILVAVTDRGDYVLDNLYDEVKAWAATGYFWQTRQDQGNPLRWVQISNPRAAR